MATSRDLYRKTVLAKTAVLSTTVCVVLAMTVAAMAAGEPEGSAAKTTGSETKGKAVKQLKVGDKAPAFNLLDQQGKKVSLSDLKGKKVLVYFYPKADTPGCTKQACGIRDNAAKLKKEGIVAVGISPDQPGAQKKFDEKYKLGFGLLSDADHKVASAYNAWRPVTRKGETRERIIRSSFLIDEKGKIAQVSYQVKPEDTIPNALKALEKKTGKPADEQ